MVHVRTMESRQPGSYAREDKPILSGEAEASGRVACSRVSHDAGETRVIRGCQNGFNPCFGKPATFLVSDHDFPFAPEAYDRQQPGAENDTPHRRPPRLIIV